MRSYHEDVTGLLRSAWNAPGAAPPPPRRVWRDWVLVALVVVGAVLEATLRTDLTQPLVAAIVVVGAAPTLLWRRTRPLLMLVIAIGATAVAALLLDNSILYASAFIVFPLYALFRWGNGRALLFGCGLVLVNLVLSALAGTPFGDLVGEAAFFAIVATLGVALRFRARARMRELDRAKLMEREMLARDLHDTVAHHVSAIAIRAQAGLATAALKPDAASDALSVIEAEASRTLAEMRAMVRVLRQGAGPRVGARTHPRRHRTTGEHRSGGAARRCPGHRVTFRASRRPSPLRYTVWRRSRSRTRGVTLGTPPSSTS